MSKISFTSLLRNSIQITLIFTVLGPSQNVPVYDRSHVALIAQLGEHCTGIAEVVGSNPAQSLNFFQVSVLVVFNGRTCINYRYHSIATMGQITLIFTVLGPSQNVPI